MNKKDTAVILGIIKTAYPNFGNGANNEQLVDLWHTMFEGDSAALVAAAVKTFIATDEKGFPPHIGAIKAQLSEITSGEKLTEMEAWLMVKNAMSAYATHEDFLKLPPAVQRAVGGSSQLVTWALTELDSLSVIQSHFMRSYRAAVEAENKRSMLPKDVRELVGKIDVKQLTMGAEGEDKEDAV